MSARTSLAGAIGDGLPFVVITAFWLVITAVVYGAFVLAWPSIPEAEPWMHLGVYLFPAAGFFGHTLQQALKSSRA